MKRGRAKKARHGMLFCASLFHGAGIGAGLFQGRHHLFRRDDRRVEGDRVDFPS